MPISLIKEEQKHVLRVLPLLLKEDKQFRHEIEVVLSEAFATKDELRQVLEEIRLSREEANRRLDQMDKRLDQMDKRLDQMDKRLDQMDKRLDQMDKRLDQVDHRLEEQGKDIASLTRTVDNLTRTVDKMWMSIGAIGSRWGIEAEVTIRNTLRELLAKDLKVAEVSEWKIKDRQGKVGQPNSDIQVDLLIRNGEHFLAEIKSSADEAHVNRLYKIGELYIEEVGIKPKLLFVAVTMREKGKLLCQDMGIQLITYDELEQ